MQANSICLKPMKHIVMGMGVKSMTGSKKLVTALNRFGYCINYTLIQEYENILACNIAERNLSTPDGLQLSAGLATGLAFDNYDEMTETLDGHNTLHDTVGIAYQNIKNEVTTTENAEYDTIESSSLDPSTSIVEKTSNERNKKRSLSIEDRKIQPYLNKKTKSSKKIHIY